MLQAGSNDFWIVAAVEREVPMKCDFEKICLLLDRKLNLRWQLKVLDHLERCEICFEAARQIIRDRDANLYVRESVNDRLAS